MQWKWPWARRPGREGAPERKAGWPGGYVALHLQAEAAWTRRDYATLSREGFMKNPVVHRCVRLIAETAAAVPWLLYDGGEELSRHPLLSLLERPNPRAAGASFLETLYGHLLISGNAYVELAEAGPDLRELHVLRPDRVAVVCDGQGWPAALEYRTEKDKRLLPIGDAGQGGALHLCAVPSARRPSRLSAAGGGADGARYPQCGGALEQGAARQFGPALRRAGLCAEGWRQPDRRAVRRGSRRNWRRATRAPAGPGGRCCWKAGSTGRR